MRRRLRYREVKQQKMKSIGTLIVAPMRTCYKQCLGIARGVGLIMGILLLSEVEVGVVDSRGDLTDKTGEVR